MQQGCLRKLAQAAMWPPCRLQSTADRSHACHRAATHAYRPKSSLGSHVLAPWPLSIRSHAELVSIPLFVHAQRTKSVAAAGVLVHAVQWRRMLALWRKPFQGISQEL